MTDLVPYDGGLAGHLSSARTYAEDEQATATRQAYRSDWKHFCTWCRDRALPPPLPSPPEVVCAYIAALADAGIKASTIARRLAAIAYAHRQSGFSPSPTAAEPVKAVLSGIRRRIGVPVERKAPATARAVGQMIKRMPADLAGARDRALILMGFAAALRRSELVALEVKDLERSADGIIVHVRRSKTDQEGRGHEIAVPRGHKLRPVEALERYLELAGITDGPVFRPIDKAGQVGQVALADGSVAQIVKRWAAAAKLDPKTFSGHSLRAGFVTSALESGADLFRIMDVTRHRRVETLQVYDRRSKLFTNHAGKGFL